MSSATSIVERFEQIVRAQPGDIAVLGSDGDLSYQELNRRANRLARLIRAQGIPAEGRVAFQVPRGPERIVTMLAILKAGAAYVPLDPYHPASHRTFMIDDAECSLVITRGGDLPEEVMESRSLIDLTSLDDCDLPAEDGDLGLQIGRHSLAYIIYTSGSTGRPKGVLVEHGGVVLLADSVARFFEGLEVRRHYQFFNITFDASVWEIFNCLLNGIELLIDEKGPEGMEPDGLLDMLDANGIDCFLITPSYLARATPRSRRSLRTIVVCGEACPLSLARAWSEHYTFVNAYGPTENTVAATLGTFDPWEETVTIGAPLQHVTVLILDDDGNPVPPGETGEICLAGPAVARGYQGRPDLTARVFVPDRFEGSGGSHIYRTGDLGYERPDGRFEFIGRKDDQVKIRGCRVEPAEIESKLEELSWVTDAAVVAFGDQSSRSLAAYLGARDGGSPSAAREHLRSQLPSYMVPLLIEVLLELPLLSSGKTDRKRLRETAEASFAAASDDGQRVRLNAPGEERLDEFLATIWAEVLGRSEVGDDDDFFDLGGHSALAARVVRRVGGLIGEKVPLRLLFEHPTLGAFKEAVRDLEAGGAIGTSAGEEGG
jgi:amino acid adenylation domain-containing protein